MKQLTLEKGKTYTGGCRQFRKASLGRLSVWGISHASDSKSTELDDLILEVSDILLTELVNLELGTTHG